MATIVTRTGKGSALTATELDANFTNLNDDKLETSGGTLSGDLSVTGDIAVTGTVDGRDVATDGTKLDGIEASADVTDTANVTAAGALMDSEVTNLAQVKAFDSADYATAAQGTTADNALPKSGGTLTGDLNFGDNDKAIFGDGNDLQIFHSGSDSYINETGTGNLNIKASNNLYLMSGSSELYAKFTTDGAATLYHNNAAKLATTSTGIDVTGNVDLPDNGKLLLGTGDDLQIYHDGTDSYITDTTGGNFFINEEGSGYLMMKGSDLYFRNPSNADMIHASSGSYVKLYHNGSEKLATTSTGIDVTGDVSLGDNGKAKFGAGNDLQIYHSGSESRIDENGAGNLKINADNLEIYNSASSEAKAKFNTNGSVQLYYDNAEKLATTSTGINVTGTVSADGLTVDGDSTVDSITYTTSSSFPTTGVTLNANGFSYEMAGTQGKIFRSAGNSKALMQLSSNNDISFYEDTGTTPKLFWDASAERLGIGTSAPISKLNLHNDYQVFTNTGGSWYHMYVGNAVNSLAFGVSNSNGSLQTIERMRLTHDGKLGLGTSSPSTPLAVHNAISSGQAIAEFRSTGNSNSTIDLRADGTGDPQILFDLNGASAFALGVDNSDGDKFKISGGYQLGTNDRFVIDSSGNVNIGSTNSGVGGSIDLSVGNTSSTGGITLWSPTNGTHSLGFGDGYTGTDRYRGYLEYSHSDDSMRLATGSTERMRITASGDVEVKSGKELKVYRGDNATYGSMKYLTGSGGLQFNDHNSDGISFVRGGSTESMRIDSSGNVGIGTSSPTGDGTALHIHGSSASTLHLTNSTTGSAISDGFDIVTDGLDALLRNRESGAIKFRIGSSEAMRIDSSGNVGIGQSNPSFKLHVTSADANDDVAYIHHDNAAQSSGTLLKVRSDAGASNGYSLLDVQNNSGTALYVAGDNKVGIGTSSPSYKLDVFGSSAVSMIRTNDTTSPTLGLFVNSGSNGVGTISVDNGGHMTFDTGSTGAGQTERMRIDSSGNLLVGKTSADNTTAGCRVRGDGFASFVRSGAEPALINRLTDDGSLLTLQKDGTTVGSILSDSGSHLIIKGAGNNAALLFNHASSRIEPYSNSATDLGRTHAKFKDLYLSGGVYLGGTGAANKLDDYEEGTWTPTVYGSAIAGTATYGQRVGTYTKVGNLAYVQVYLIFSSFTGTSEMRISGLPFTPEAVSYENHMGSTILHNIALPSGTVQVTPRAIDGVGYLRLTVTKDNAAKDQVLCDSSGEILISLTYRTT